MKNPNDFLTPEEVKTIFPDASPEEVVYIIATIANMTDLFFEIMKREETSTDTLPKDGK